MTLSDKEEYCFCSRGCRRKKYRKEHVKEFIRELKKELFDEAFKREVPLTDSSLDHLPMAYINKIIDKLAGDKLITKQEEKHGI